MTRALWIATGVCAAAYYALGVDRYATYHSGSDLGLFTQSISTVFHGFANTPEGGSHFTFHFSPVLYLCAPLLLATHSPLALVAIQAVAGALVIPPLYYIARKRVPERLAFAIACVGALYPPLVGTTFTDFHENGFAPAATLWLLWAVDARRYTAAAAFVALALAIKEDQAVILAASAVCGGIFFARRRDKAGAAFAVGVFVASLATFAIFFAAIRPLAGATDAWAPTHFYTWSRLVDPRGSAPWYSIGRPAYFLEAMVPLAFVCVASPAFLLALPGFAEVLGSHESITYTMGTHYAAVWIPYVLFAYVLAIAAQYRRSPHTARRLVQASIALCLLVLAFASPTHWAHYLRARNLHDAVLDRAVARLPADIDVGTFDETYAHLGFDPRAQLGMARAPRYVLVDATLRNSWFTVAALPVLQSGMRSGAYRRIWGEDGVQLFERCDPGAGGRHATRACR